MTVISRKEDDSIRIGCDITVRVMRSAGGVVLLGVEAPPGTPVVRAEMVEPRNSKPFSDVGPLWQQDLSTLLFPNDTKRQASGLRTDTI